MAKERTPESELSEIEVDGVKMILTKGVSQRLRKLILEKSRYAPLIPPDQKMSKEEIDDAIELKQEIVEQQIEYEKAWISLRGMD